MSGSNKNQHVSSIAVTATLLIALAATTVVLLNSTRTPTAIAENATSQLGPEEAIEVFGAFGEKQGKGDELPGFLIAGPQELDGIQSETTRRLGSREGFTYWLALNGSQEFCLISLLDGADQYASMTCQSPKSVWSHGIAMQFAEKTRSVQLYFVPEPFAQSVEGFDLVGGQLLVGSASYERQEIILNPVDTMSRVESLTIPAQEPLVWED